MGYECPTCGTEFDSRRGLGVHHSRTHGERLPNRECDECGTEFYCEYDRKYCSEECRQESISFDGMANPNYRGGQETTECNFCDREFEYYPSVKEGKYCPKCVEEESWRDPPVSTGSDHPRWSGGRVEAECVICGTSTRRYPSEMTGDVVVCSGSVSTKVAIGCLYWVWSSQLEGWWERSVRQRVERSEKKALERDGYECVVCSKTKAEIGRNPDVHHIVPVRVFAQAADKTKEDAHTLDNVVTLCVSCHRKADFGRISRDRLRSSIDPA